MTVLIERISASTSPRDTKWADGLRGIAAVFVATSHLVLGYGDWLRYPRPAEHAAYSLWQLPYIRIFVEGFPWVSAFLLLTGFVNALGPIKKARAGKIEASLAGLASSCFRRTFRLILPCTAATVFSWIICELGGYKMGKLVESGWMIDTSPEPSVSINASIRRFIWAIYSTWARGGNALEKNQWVMAFFLKASLSLYVVLLAVVRAQPRYRMLIFVGLIMFSWVNKDTHGGIPVYSGALLAELSMTPLIIDISQSRRPYRFIPYFLIALGFYFLSYPAKHAEWAGWSASLKHIGGSIFPAAIDVYWSLVAVFLIVLAIITSARLQQAFSHPYFLWLGTHSFPIYLVHGPLLRSVLNWLLFAFTTPKSHEDLDQDGHVKKVRYSYPLPSGLKFFAVLPFWFALVFGAAHAWQKYLEPRFAQITKWCEETMCGPPEVALGSPVRYVPVSKRDDDEKVASPSGSASLLPV